MTVAVRPSPDRLQSIATWHTGALLFENLFSAASAATL
jgi:hypothetical protein